MCGRSRCTLTRQQVAEAAGVSPEEFIDGDKCTTRDKKCSRARCPVQTADMLVGLLLARSLCVPVDKPVENMGPGRYGPVLLQPGGEKVDIETKAKTRLQAMRVRAALEHTVSCIDCGRMESATDSLTASSGDLFRHLPRLMQSQIIFLCSMPGTATIMVGVLEPDRYVNAVFPGPRILRKDRRSRDSWSRRDV